MPLMEQRFLVTGGMGMIGSHLTVELLKRGGHVTVLDANRNIGNWMHEELPSTRRENLRVIQGDVRNERTVDKLTEDIDTVYHLAAIVGVERASADPLSTMETEIKGISNVLTSAKLNKVRRLVYASSSEVYGDSNILPLKENHAVAPLSSYGVSKLLAEHYCKAYDEGRELETVCLRVFNAYGPGQDDRFVVMRLLNNALRGVPMIIYHDGSQTRDFTYIDDVVESFILASTCTSGDVFNVGTGTETSMLELAKAIRNIVGENVKFEMAIPNNRRPEFEVRRRVADTQKARKSLGFVPRVDLKEGLQKTLAYVRKITGLP